jgi:copper homeostasis protein
VKGAVLVEAAAESLEAARAAAEGGAHRIELCAQLAVGGITPDVPLLQACRSRLTIPIFVLIRPRAGDFVFGPDEHRVMLKQIADAKAAGAQGIVTGALTASSEIAEGPTFELIAAARPLPVTSHRAIESCVDLSTALETLIRLGVDRILASGMSRVGQLVRQSRGRIAIMAGGGITADNVGPLVRETGVREIHFSVRDAAKVRAIIANAKD